MLKRELDTYEKLYQTEPSQLAAWHWSQNGESHNPYKLGTVECGEYINAFQKLMFREEKSV